MMVTMVMVMMSGVVLILIYINGGDNVNCGDGESIVGCCNNKDGGGSDSIVDVGAGTNGGSNPDFWDRKSKVSGSEDTAGNDGNCHDGPGPNNGGDVNANDNDCDEDGADADGSNSNNGADEDKNCGDEDDFDVGSNDEGGDNVDGDDKDSGTNDDDDDKDYLDIKDDHDGKGKFLQFTFVRISTIFDTNLSFLIQLDIKALFSITIYQVIGLYEPSYALSNICWFHINSIFFRLLFTFNILCIRLD